MKEYILVYIIVEEIKDGLKFEGPITSIQNINKQKVETSIKKIRCSNKCTVIPKIFQFENCLKNGLCNVLDEAEIYFDKLMDNMIDMKNMMDRDRGKRKKKS